MLQVLLFYCFIVVLVSLNILQFFTNKKYLKDNMKMEEELFHFQKIESLFSISSGVVHDVNNFLVPIISYSEILLDSFENGDERKYFLEQIYYAGRNTKELVNQFLLCLKNRKVVYRSISLNKSVEKFECILRNVLSENIDLNIHLSHGLDPIFADRNQMYQILMNLIINAKDSMPNGGTLSLETNQQYIKIKPKNPLLKNISEDVKAGVFNVLKVSDTGSGIEKENINKIFSPFYSTKGEKGTGLGLSTVIRIVKNHKGFLNVESEPGRGSTFSIYFPICSADQKIEIIN